MGYIQYTQKIQKGADNLDAHFKDNTGQFESW